jgi:hypothetical protein
MDGISQQLGVILRDLRKPYWQRLGQITHALFGAVFDEPSATWGLEKFCRAAAASPRRQLALPSPPLADRSVATNAKRRIRVDDGATPRC